jgi:hypothetical protein
MRPDGLSARWCRWWQSFSVEVEDGVDVEDGEEFLVGVKLDD